MTSATETYLLRFTGTCDEATFRARCGEQDYWYHSFYFDNGFAQRGEYDIGRDVASYGFPKNMQGMSVLDVGTASGWFATYFEQLGAEVTAVDVRGYCDWDIFGRPGYADVSTEKPVPDRILPEGRAIYYGPASKGFWIMKDLLGLKADYVNARIYDLTPQLFGGKTFDLVFAGAVLMHLRDPIGALMALRSVCRGRLIANSIKAEWADEQTPMMQLISSEKDPSSWWVPNRACLAQWLKGAGFSRFEIREQSYTTDSPFFDESGTTYAADQTLFLVDVAAARQEGLARRPEADADEELVRRVREAVVRAVRDEATVLVVSGGDDDLLKLGGRRRGWHFLRDAAGDYNGKPADDKEAITQLERLQAKGAGYLLLPEPSFWWLDHYKELKQHLETRYRRIRSNGHCIIYQLTAPKAESSL
jgi:SAM-dependent methyltransferase